MVIDKQGRKIFAHKGDPPPDEDGYERDPGDPYILIPKFIECKHRKFSQRILPCGKINQFYYCNEFNMVVLPSICNRCPVDDK